MADQKGWLNVVPGPKARYSLFFSDLTLISVALFSTGGEEVGERGELQPGQGREPPGTSAPFHLRGLCCEGGHRSNGHAGV